MLIDLGRTRTVQLTLFNMQVRENQTGRSVRIGVNSVSARVLAKALWHNHVITVLDLSSLGLSDHAGSYIARMLNRNDNLAKLDLADNQLGPRTCHVRGNQPPCVLLLHAKQCLARSLIRRVCWNRTGVRRESRL